MAEKCLLMTSLAILVCHPSSTIRCFKPKPKDKGVSKSRKGYLVFNSCTNICDSPRLNVHKPIKLLDEIVEGNPLKPIVEDVFRFGWKRGVGYKIEKILKVNHCKKNCESLEECKKMATNSRSTRSLSKNKKAERVFYHGAMVTCSLGLDKSSTRICCMKTCGVCKIIGQIYGIHEKTNWIESFSTSSWRAHRKVVKQFGDGVSKKAIIVSRVIECCKGEKYREINTLNPRAILPCFVIIYSLS
ncbi:unnamed protein product [Withania somnifera]